MWNIMRPFHQDCSCNFNPAQEIPYMQTRFINSSIERYPGWCMKMYELQITYGTTGGIIFYTGPYRLVSIHVVNQSPNEITVRIYNSPNCINMVDEPYDNNVIPPLQTQIYPIQLYSKYHLVTFTGEMGNRAIMYMQAQ